MSLHKDINFTYYISAKFESSDPVWIILEPFQNSVDSLGSFSRHWLRTIGYRFRDMDYVPSGIVRPSGKVISLVVCLETFGTGGVIRRLSLTHIVRNGNLVISSLEYHNTCMSVVVFNIYVFLFIYIYTQYVGKFKYIYIAYLPGEICSIPQYTVHFFSTASLIFWMCGQVI